MSLVHFLETLAVYRRRQASEEAGTCYVAQLLWSMGEGVRLASPGGGPSSHRGRLNKGGWGKTGEGVLVIGRGSTKVLWPL